jgi:hypothetical protein
VFKLNRRYFIYLFDRVLVAAVTQKWNYLGKHSDKHFILPPSPKLTQVSSMSSLFIGLTLDESLKKISMKKSTVVLFLLLTTVFVSAQEVVSTQGDSYSNASGSIDFTIGEVVINTGTDGTNDITQGFHQTNWNFLGVEDFAPDYEAIIFPNPTEDVLNIRTSMFENVTYTLYDAQGKIVMQDILSAEQTPIQVSQLAPGSYSLILNNQTQNLKSFKLIKTH